MKEVASSLWRKPVGITALSAPIRVWNSLETAIWGRVGFRVGTRDENSTGFRLIRYSTL